MANGESRTGRHLGIAGNGRDARWLHVHGDVPVW
jgi:hypothetical protein